MAEELAAMIGTKIKERRCVLGLTQKQLAAAIDAELDVKGGVDGQRVSDWERGVNRPSERYWPAITKVLERDRGWFYGRAEDTPPLLQVLDGEGDKLDRILAELERANEDRTEMRKLITRQNDLLGRQEDLLRKMDARLLALEAVDRALESLQAPSVEDPRDQRRKRENGA